MEEYKENIKSMLGDLGDSDCDFIKRIYTMMKYYLSRKNKKQ